MGKRLTFYAADNFSSTHGRHTWKMGLEIRQYHQVKYKTWEAGGNISFAKGQVNVRRDRQRHFEAAGLGV